MKRKFRTTLPTERVPATLTIDTLSGLVSVRPLRRHRTYDLHLSGVADMIYRAIVIAEAREKRQAKKQARGSR